MTSSQHPRRAKTGSPVRRTLGHSLDALRHLNDEQIIFWECFWRSARAPRTPARTSLPRRALTMPQRDPVPPSGGGVDRGRSGSLTRHRQNMAKKGTPSAGRRRASAPAPVSWDLRRVTRRRFAFTAGADFRRWPDRGDDLADFQRCRP